MIDIILNGDHHHRRNVFLTEVGYNVLLCIYRFYADFQSVVGGKFIPWTTCVFTNAIDSVHGLSIHL